MNRAVHGAWRSTCGTYRVTVTRSCFRAMQRLAEAAAPAEVGTALVGSYSDDGHEATVSYLAPLTSDSKGARLTFHRGANGLFEFFQELFRSSRGRTHYIGEWHSHPGGAPAPSRTDDENMFAIARDPHARCPECILVILAIARRSSEIGVFVYSKAQRRIDLHPVTEKIFAAR